MACCEDHTGHMPLTRQNEEIDHTHQEYQGFSKIHRSRGRDRYCAMRGTSRASTLLDLSKARNRIYIAPAWAPYEVRSLNLLRYCDADKLPVTAVQL